MITLPFVFFIVLLVAFAVPAVIPVWGAMDMGRFFAVLTAGTLFALVCTAIMFGPVLTWK